MKSKSKKRKKASLSPRERHNAELLKRMQDPEDDLKSYSASATWFQPRPIIKKDPKEIKRLYGDNNDS